MSTSINRGRKPRIEILVEVRMGGTLEKLTEFLKMELEVEGYEVEVAADGASGLIALRGRDDQASTRVLRTSDWELPGCRLCRYFRAPERANSRDSNHSSAWTSAISLLPRRLAPGCRLWRYFRAPERTDSSRDNHPASRI